MGSLRTFIDTKHVELERWGPPRADADWDAFWHTIYKGIEGQEWEELYDHYKEFHQAAGTEKPDGGQKAKALWAMNAARDRDVEFV